MNKGILMWPFFIQIYIYSALENLALWAQSESCGSALFNVGGNSNNEITMITDDEILRDDFKKCVDFHGHICPGLAIGYRASRAALEWMDEKRARDEEMIATVETDACGTDAIQVLIGCTAGKGNLIQKDYGKHVYTIMGRNSGKGVRISLKAGTLDLSERHQELIQRIMTNEITERERKEFWNLHVQKAREILEKPLKDLFTIEPANIATPPKAMIEASIPCGKCGEPTMVSKLVDREGSIICRDCLEKEQ